MSIVHLIELTRVDNKTFFLKSPPFFWLGLLYHMPHNFIFFSFKQQELKVTYGQSIDVFLWAPVHIFMVLSLFESGLQGNSLKTCSLRLSVVVAPLQNSLGHKSVCVSHHFGWKV